MPQKCKEKICIDCKTPYIPTSNVQKHCPDCMKSKSRAAGTKPAVRRSTDNTGKSHIEKNAGRSCAHLLKPAQIAASFSLQGAVDLFLCLADAGCTAIVFGNTKISIERVQ